MKNTVNKFCRYHLIIYNLKLGSGLTLLNAHAKDKRLKEEEKIVHTFNKMLVLGTE